MQKQSYFVNPPIAEFSVTVTCGLIAVVAVVFAAAIVRLLIPEPFRQKERETLFPQSSIMIQQLSVTLQMADHLSNSSGSHVHYWYLNHWSSREKNNINQTLLIILAIKQKHALQQPNTQHTHIFVFPYQML